MPIKDRAHRYIDRMPPAIAGSGGHGATFHVAVTLIKGFALDECTALELLTAWNETHCQPRWSERDLRHKLRSAAQASSTRAMGYLLDEKPFSVGHFYGYGCGGNTSSTNAVTDSYTDTDSWKARQRAAWPKIVPLTQADIQAVSKMRRLPLAAVDLAAKARFLGASGIDGHRAFIIAEGRFAQGRRFDGQPFLRPDGTTLKAKNLCGSEGAFIGQRWLGTSLSCPILLVEGVIALLEAAAAILLAERFDWTCLAATSAASRFARDPALLARLAGRRIRIIPDADEAGLDAAGAWLAALEGVGATVDALALPKPYKDLGELIAECHRDHLTTHLTTHLSVLFTL